MLIRAFQERRRKKKVGFAMPASPSDDNSESQFVEVWQSNLDEAFERIIEIVDDYGYVAMVKPDSSRAFSSLDGVISFRTRNFPASSRDRSANFAARPNTRTNCSSATSICSKSFNSVSRSTTRTA